MSDDNNLAPGDALILRQEAMAMRITNAAEHAAAADFLRFRIKAVEREVDSYFDPVIKAAHASHRAALAQKSRALAPLLEAERIVKGLIADYHQREMARQTEEATRRAEEARKAEEGRRLETAAFLEREGDQEAAEAVLGAPIVVSEMPVEAPKAEGVSVRRSWGWKLVDEGKVKPHFLQPDEKAIAAVVATLGPAAAEVVGGIEVYEKLTVAARA